MQDPEQRSQGYAESRDQIDAEWQKADAMQKSPSQVKEGQANIRRRKQNTSRTSIVQAEFLPRPAQLILGPPSCLVMPMPLPFLFAPFYPSPTTFAPAE